MAGCKSFHELESLTEELSLPMRRQLKIPRRIPDTALRTTVCKLEPESLREGLRRQAKAVHRRKALGPLGTPFGQVAIDGKHTAIDAWDDLYAPKPSASIFAAPNRSLAGSILPTSSLAISAGTI